MQRSSRTCRTPSIRIDNFFNGTISTGGVDLGGRTPQYANQLGFDRDRLSVPEGTIPNGAHGATVCLGTVGDTYFFGGIAFDTLIRAPNLQIDKKASADTANPGDMVTYTTEVSNPQPAGRARRRPSRPPTWWSTTRCRPGWTSRTSPSTPTAAAAYDAETRSIRCDVGTLQPDATFEFAYRATVSAAAQGTAPAAAAQHRLLSGQLRGPARHGVLRLRRGERRGAAESRTSISAWSRPCRPTSSRPGPR